MRKKLSLLFKNLSIKKTIIKNGFWFVDIPRTSSSSLRVELGREFGALYGKSNLIEEKYKSQKCFRDHTTAESMRDDIGTENWNRLFTFSIVRNPWERQYSMYLYRKKIHSIPENWSFEFYIESLQEGVLTRDGYFKYHGHRLGAADYITESSGKIIIDYVGKFEERSTAIKEIAKNIHCQALGNLKLQSARKGTDSYTHYYSERTKEIIHQIYHEDIRLFNYEFDQRYD